MKQWAPASWQSKQSTQKFDYLNPTKVIASMEKLAQLPPLVTAMEISKLKKQLTKVAQGEAFLLQGGDCAESFANCRAEPITNKLKILLQMSLILIHGMRKPVIRVGRIAGQYAKPRTDAIETQGKITLPSYRGDLVNKPGFSRKERELNPELMVEGYHYAALTLNYIRALVDGGFADLQHPEYWDLDFVKHSPLAEQYQSLVYSLHDTLSFIKSISGVHPSNLNRIEFYTSHEALNLFYEQPLTRKMPDDNYYALSTHFPWIGMRTAQLDGAHVEYFRGIVNPIAVKIGVDMSAENLLELINILNPTNEAGRLTLIVRLGIANITHHLPKLIAAVKSKNKQIVWCCDPMHGNTHKTETGIKTRRFEDILFELTQSFQIHREMGSYLGGVHFELTGENVTECIGGARGLSESDLLTAYETLLDPRLNYEQALEMAMIIARQ